MSWRKNFYLKSFKYHAYKKFVGTREWKGDYLFETALRGLRSGDVAIDCGAHVGQYTKKLAATGAVVHAFEPDPENFKTLKANLAGQSNVILHNAAVDVSSGEAKLYFSRKPVRQGRNSEGSSLIREKEFIEEDDYVVVKKVDFINFMEGINHISVIKMDIEGAELDIINKIIDSGIVNRIERMFVETHEIQIPSKAKEFLTLRNRVESKFRKKIYMDWH